MKTFKFTMFAVMVGLFVVGIGFQVQAADKAADARLSEDEVDAARVRDALSNLIQIPNPMFGSPPPNPQTSPKIKTNAPPNAPTGIKIDGKPLPVVKVDWEAERRKFRKCFGKQITGAQDRCRPYDYNNDRVVDGIDELMLREREKR